MKKCLTVLLLAMIILASFTAVEAKNQNAQQNSNVNSKIEGGHHNSISTEVNQIGHNAEQDSNVDSEIKAATIIQYLLKLIKWDRMHSKIQTWIVKLRAVTTIQ